MDLESMLSLEDMRQIMPHGRSGLAMYFDPLTDAMREFDIDNDLRQAAFISQIAHESGELRYAEEIASGEAYEGRTDLGNTQPGDGVRFKGRGLIQITGRANYTSCGHALGLDLISEPLLLAQPVPACRSAGWFWKSRGLNELADVRDFESITRRINGGLNGYADRQRYYFRALGILGQAE